MKTDYLINIFLGIVFSAIIITACDDTVPPEFVDIPSSNVSYSRHIQPVFNRYCTDMGCHNDSEVAGDLSLTSHSNTTENYLIVAPGYPDNSRLIWSIEGKSTSPMPPYGSYPLNANQRAGIRTWVKEGAKNN